MQNTHKIWEWNTSVVFDDPSNLGYVLKIPKDSWRFFPDSFKRPKVFDELDSNNTLLRTEAMNKVNLNLPKGEIIVTYPEAIFEKVIDPAVIAKEQIEITKGENLDLDTIVVG